MTEARLEKAPVTYDDQDKIDTGLCEKPKKFLLKMSYRSDIKPCIRYPDLAETAAFNEKYQETLNYLTIKCL